MSGIDTLFRQQEQQSGCVNCGQKGCDRTNHSFTQCGGCGSAYCVGDCRETAATASLLAGSSGGVRTAAFASTHAPDITSASALIGYAQRLTRATTGLNDGAVDVARRASELRRATDAVLDGGIMANIQAGLMEAGVPASDARSMAQSIGSTLGRCNDALAGASVALKGATQKLHAALAAADDFRRAAARVRQTGPRPGRFDPDS